MIIGDLMSLPVSETSTQPLVESQVLTHCVKFET